MPFIQYYHKLSNQSVHIYDFVTHFQNIQYC